MADPTTGRALGGRASSDGHLLRNAVLVAVIAITSACGSSTAPTPVGTVTGVVTSTLGGGLAGAYVTVTPDGGTALTRVITASGGTYGVQRVPVGSGAVTLPVVPNNCTSPPASPYSGLTNGGTVTVNVTVTCFLPPGNVVGTIVNSAGGYISGATVTVTPSAAPALPSVTSQVSGAFAVHGVTVGNGSGNVLVSGVPATCTAPAPVPYSGLVQGGSLSLIVNVTCTTPSAMSLAAGQSAVFADASNFQTQLVMPANAEFLITVVNTDTAVAAAGGGFTLAGAPAPTTTLVRGPLRGLRSNAPFGVVRVAPRLGSASSSPSTPWLQLLQRMQRKHMATLDFNRQVFARYGRPRGAEGGVGPAGGATTHPSSLVKTKVGDINKIYVNKLTSGSCDAVDSINARTVYVGTSVQVLADTARWIARPDPSFFAAYGSEFDAVTYPHLLAVEGDPLAYDQLLSGVGKVTIVFTPLVNNGGDAGFVNACDLLPRSRVQFSNVTEMIYGWTPDTARLTVDFWERDFRGVTAHEAKHVVSLSHHEFDGASSFEQSWLEEGMAQQSEEIWMRHFNDAGWRSAANFQQTAGCEFIGSETCYHNTNPYFFSDRVFPELELYLHANSSDPTTGGISFTSNGKYGGGWAFIRWVTDVFGGADEGNYIKALIDDPASVGMANVSKHAGLPSAQLLVYWSLASAFDSSTFTDSATFHPTDSLVTIPSFNFRNDFAVAGAAGYWGFGRQWPVNTTVLASTFNAPVPRVNGTAGVYFLLPAGSSASQETLQLLAADGSPILASSPFRVGVIRVR